MYRLCGFSLFSKLYTVTFSDNFGGWGRLTRKGDLLFTCCSCRFQSLLAVPTVVSGLSFPPLPAESLWGRLLPWSRLAGHSPQIRNLHGLSARQRRPFILVEIRIIKSPLYLFLFPRLIEKYVFILSRWNFLLPWDQRPFMCPVS